jgi:hypothetical protein
MSTFKFSYEGPYVVHRGKMLESGAYRSLGKTELKILARLEIGLMRHRGTNNGRIICTYDDFAGYGIRRPSIPRALRRLRKVGLLAHHANGNFKKGHNSPGPGRPKGSQAKVTVALKEAILQAGELAGGAEGLVGCLKMLARDNSSAYAGLLAKILPSTFAPASDSDGGRVELRFVREIVYPGGRTEIEGVTPKALPAPDDAFQPDATCTRHEDYAT